MAPRPAARLRALGARLTASGGIPPVELPAWFAGVLRPYQAAGVDWLQFLRECAPEGGLGGYDFDRLRRKLGLLEAAPAPAG